MTKLLLLCTSLMLWLPNQAFANTDEENRLKAALIYKMGLYVTWNNEPEKLNYCFIGKKSEAIASVLKSKFAQGRLPAKVNFLNKASIKDVAKLECQVLFAASAGSSENTKFQEISQSTLTIAGSSNQLKHGLIASIEIKNRKPQLSVSKSNLKRSNIKIDTRLLAAVNFKD